MWALFGGEYLGKKGRKQKKKKRKGRVGVVDVVMGTEETGKGCGCGH